jgi:2-polyprenyl-6-methoxyphenol hydroxylase-like FAD-dependent oxidoreductase
VANKNNLPVDARNAIAPTGIYDVIIIGAGPVGLATAIGLRKRGIENLLVIDQTRAFRQVGQTVDLLPNGLKALKYIDSQAYEEVKKTGNKLFSSKQSNDGKTPEITQATKPAKVAAEWVQKNLQGQRISSFSLRYDDWLRDYGEGRVSISWYELQNTLRKQLPEDLVKPNHRCINVVDEPEIGCVRVDCVSDTTVEANPYAHWIDSQKDGEIQSQNSLVDSQQSETKFFRAKLVVAADGINSTARQVIYKDSPYAAFAKPEYSGFAAIICGQIVEIPNEIQTELEEKFFEDSPVVTISDHQISDNSTCQENPRMMLFRRNGQVGYIIHAALPLESLQEKSSSSLIDLAVRELERTGYPNVLKQLVRISPPDNMRQRLYYIHRATISDTIQLPSTAILSHHNYLAEIQPAWSAGRIVLVGDAAHGMPPFMAQGANQGLEDALAMTTLVAKISKNNSWDDKQAIAQAWEKYERLRRPFMVRIQKATLKQIPSSVEKERQEYNQQVYSRNFDQVIEALF